LQSTEALSAESYWNLINSCEGYALSLFDDIYPLSRKPEKPESEVISD